VNFSYFKANYLDASAAVKLVIAERGSDHLNAYFANRSGFFITSFCLFEALSVLKRKMCKEEISREQYFDACYLLLSHLRTKRIRIDDEPKVDSLQKFERAEKLAKLHRLDLSDALQLVGVKHGKFCKLAKESKTVLITADRSLAKAAKTEGLRVWNCEEEPGLPDH
jgi:predicted nucleic acid-binding protein